MGLLFVVFAGTFTYRYLRNVFVNGRAPGINCMVLWRRLFNMDNNMANIQGLRIDYWQ